MANCTQLSLGYNVDKATRQKIVSGEYLHLGALLVRDPTKSQVSTLSLDTQDQLVAQPKSVAKIASIDNWTEAFLIFASIYPRSVLRPKATFLRIRLGNLQIYYMLSELQSIVGKLNFFLAKQFLEAELLIVVSIMQ